MNIEETIKIVGNSGKKSEISYEELAKKKPNPKLEVYKNFYNIRLTEWYRLDQNFIDINEASSTMIKIIQKLYKISH